MTSNMPKSARIFSGGEGPNYEILLLPFNFSDSPEMFRELVVFAEATFPDSRANLLIDANMRHRDKLADVLMTEILRDGRAARMDPKFLEKLLAHWVDQFREADLKLPYLLEGINAIFQNGGLSGLGTQPVSDVLGELGKIDNINVAETIRIISKSGVFSHMTMSEAQSFLATWRDSSHARTESYLDALVEGGMLPDLASAVRGDTSIAL